MVSRASRCIPTHFTSQGLGATTGAMALANSTAFIGSVRKWSKRLGAIPFSNAANALSCKVQIETLGCDFTSRFMRLRRLYDVMQAVNTSVGKGRIRLDPAEAPQSCLCHVYLCLSSPSSKEEESSDTVQAASLDTLDSLASLTSTSASADPAVILQAAHDRAASATGIRLWNSLRGSGHSMGYGREGTERYFEWSIGPANGAVEDSKVSHGWTCFFGELDSF